MRQLEDDPRSRSLFVVLEGIDGAGKTALAKAVHVLTERLCDDTLLCRFPSDGRIGSVIRKSLAVNIWTLKASPFSDGALLHLFLADFMEEAATIEDTRSRGGIVISDRYTLSTRVYQIDHLSPFTVHAAVRNVERLIPEPDLTVLVTVSAEEASAKIKARWSNVIGVDGQRLADPDLDRLQVYATRYAQAAGAITAWGTKGEDAVLIVDGSLDTDHLADQVLERMLKIREANIEAGRAAADVREISVAADAKSLTDA